MSRILWVTERYPPSPGGMATSCARQVQALRARDRELDLVAIGGAAAELEVRTVPRDRGTDSILSRSVSRGYLAQKIWSLVRDRHQLAPYSSVVGFGASFPGYLAVTLAAWLEIPAMVSVRGNDLDRDWFDPRRSPMVQEALRRADLIGAVASEMADRIRALFPDRRVRFAGNGIDTDRWALLPEDRDRRDLMRAKLAGDGRTVVGIFGELKPKKRVPFWLAAMRRGGLMDRLSLLVVGRADPETEGILADPVLVPRIHRVPFVEPDQLAGLYAAVDFVVLPSMFEGMPNVLLEAMACGAIPLCAAAGGMPDVVRDGVEGFLFRAEDASAAAEAMERALSLDPASRRAMVERGAARLRTDFSLSAETDRIEELLRELETKE